MNNEIQVFVNDLFGSVRILTQNDGKVLFCGKDVAVALGYSNTKDAIARHCRWVVKHDLPHPQSENKTIEMSFITEGNLYRLITHSKLPDAEKFEKWVFDEVIPSVRKHGAYMTDQVLEKALLSPDYLIQLATQLKKEQAYRKQLEQDNILKQQKIEEDKPKVLFAEAVSVSKTSILVGDLAKILKQNGVDIGQNRLFKWLRENGYLIRRKGESYNMPTQSSLENGWFEIKESTGINPDGSIRISKTTKVTGKGQQYFINKFLRNMEESA